MSWDPKDGNYLMHLHMRDDPDSPDMQVREIAYELRDGRSFRLTPESSRNFIQFALTHPDLEDQAAMLQELQIPGLNGTSVELWHVLRDCPAGMVII